MAGPAVLADGQNHHHNHDQHLPVRDPRQPSSLPPSTSATTSSDSDDPMPRPVDAAYEDEAGDMVGVSMSPAQTRMKARSTPAEEKNRIMERNGNYFESIPDHVQADGLYLSDITAEPEAVEDKSKPSTTAPEPSQQQQQEEVQQAQKSESIQGQGKEVTYREDTRLPKDNGSRSSFTRSILSGLPKRPRALSGDAIANLSLKKLLPDLGSLTRRSSLSLRTGMPGQNNCPRSQTVKSPPTSKPPLEEQVTEPPKSPNSPLPERRRSASHTDGDGVVDEPISELQSLGGLPGAKHSFSRRPSAGPPGAPPLLRRTSSDHSLYLRTSSTASSLDNRPQFENVHSQVNSRFKAIKDSLQDSSSRLLTMPTFSLHDIRSDWGYKPFMYDSAQRKNNNDADVEEPSSAQEDQQQQRSPRPNPNATLHPVLTEAMDELTGDVVVMGGYRGSILRSAKPPHRQLWVPMKVGLNLRKVDLEVGFNPEDEENMADHVIPSGVLSHVGPVDICRRLMKRLEKCDNALNGDLRVWDYGYDWRLSPHLLSKRLIEYLQGLPCNAPDVPHEKRGAYVVAHSLGGLITRHAVNQRPDLFAGVIYAGVPQHCVNILGPMRNGDDVLLSSRVLTAQVNFSFRTSFALLPEDGHCFFNRRTKKEYCVDFFSPKTWEECRLSPCVGFALPTGKNLKDNLPMLAKRLSTVLSDDSDPAHHEPEPVSSSATMPQHQEQLEDNAHHNPPRNATNPHEAQAKSSAMKPTMDGLVGPTANLRGAANVKAATTTTIPHDVAMAYLERVLPEIRRFKEELAFNPSHQAENRYPPFAVVFGKSVPTVYGARVSSREGIKHQDAYDDLAFAAGDGVCLASAAMMPPGYRIIKDGLVRSDRGHVGLLGDLEGMGQCFRALVKGRRERVGCGLDSSSDPAPANSNYAPVSASASASDSASASTPTPAVPI